MDTVTVCGKGQPASPKAVRDLAQVVPGAPSGGGLVQALSRPGGDATAPFGSWTRERVVDGERPAEMPVQQPSSRVSTVHAGAAGALGLEVPAALRMRATELIE